MTANFIPYDKVSFELTEEQVSKLNEWLAEVEKRASKIQAERAESKGRQPATQKSPYYGAIGGGVSFTFSNNALGTVCKVTEVITGETLDLTNYEDW